MDSQKQNQGNQPQKDFGNQPNRGQEQNQPGHQGQPNRGQEQPNQPRKENEQQPTKK